MARTFNLDPAADFDGTVDGTDQVGEELTGPGGFQAAIRGLGSAPTLTSDDTLVIKAGTMAIDRLILMECDADVSGWNIDDVVQNGDDDGGTPGAEWTGVVVQGYDEDSTGLADTGFVLIQL
ncbi:unnamed protein product, partial [marine sediment metagenome]